MMILGINYYFHDSTACLIKDGQLLVAIEEERLSREKHTRAFPEAAIQRCLNIAGITYDDIDHIALSIQPKLHAGAKAAYLLKNPKFAAPFLKHELVQPIFKQRDLNAWYNKHWSDSTSKPQIHPISHHHSHGKGSFFVSPYEEAAILTLDGAGEWATSWLGYGSGNKVTDISQSFFPHSLGSIYESVTEFCGFKPNYDEGKTMGLAPFGDASRFHAEAAKCVEIDDEGRIHVDLSYFSFQSNGYQRCAPKFHHVFGKARDPEGQFLDHHHDVAAAFQRVLEECALKQASVLRKHTNAKHLIVAGGVALNSVMNGRLVRESPFDDIYVMPAAGDNGTAIGAAYCVYNDILGQKRNFIHNNPYIGTEYSNDEIETALKSCKLKYQYIEDIEEAAAARLHHGEIIGWFQGKMEIGPRALGARSILGNPTLAHMKDKINAEVKHREAYRPFAPSTLTEARQDYFDIDVEAPFMLKVCQVKEKAKATLPAITHVDGSARLQTVSEDISPRYYKLIKAFGQKSGVPVVLNTSFNIMGEPVVESPLQAIRCFFSTGLDSLVIGNYIIDKK